MGSDGNNNLLKFLQQCQKPNFLTLLLDHTWTDKK